MFDDMNKYKVQVTIPFSSGQRFQHYSVMSNVIIDSLSHNPFFIRSTIPTQTKQKEQAKQEEQVTIPFSSGQRFQLIFCPCNLRPGEPWSQSLFHQVNDSNELFCWLSRNVC